MELSIREYFNNMRPWRYGDIADKRSKPYFVALGISEKLVPPNLWFDDNVLARKLAELI